MSIIFLIIGIISVAYGAAIYRLASVYEDKESKGDGLAFFLGGLFLIGLAVYSLVNDAPLY